jgi:hypothetical protein
MVANRHNVPKLSWVDNQTLKVGLSVMADAYRIRAPELGSKT